MRCPKCGYISFDHLAACSKCGRDLAAQSQELNGTAVEVETPFFLGAALGMLGAGGEIEAAVPTAAGATGAEIAASGEPTSVPPPPAPPEVEEELEPLTLENVIDEVVEESGEDEKAGRVPFNFDEIDLSDLVSTLGNTEEPAATEADDNEVDIAAEKPASRKKPTKKP